jgi:hypothetical protein
VEGVLKCKIYHTHYLAVSIRSRRMKSTWDEGVARFSLMENKDNKHPLNELASLDLCTQYMSKTSTIA